MKNLNKELLKEELKSSIAHDKYDLPIFICKNLKIDLINVFKRYLSFEEEDLKLSVKLLKNNKYYFEIECFADNIFFKKM